MFRGNLSLLEIFSRGLTQMAAWKEGGREGGREGRKGGEGREVGFGGCQTAYDKDDCYQVLIVA